MHMVKMHLISLAMLEHFEELSSLSVLRTRIYTVKMRLISIAMLDHFEELSF